MHLHQREHGKADRVGAYEAPFYTLGPLTLTSPLATTTSPAAIAPHDRLVRTVRHALLRHRPKNTWDCQTKTNVKVRPVTHLPN